MAKVVLIVDSETGALVDVAGNVREDGGRYSKFARRFLSLAKNPELDYGVNGGDTLNISKGGVNGAQINLNANVVRVSGTLKVGEQTIQDLIDSRQIASIASAVRGTPGEISVTETVDAETGNPIVVISLDPTVSTKIQELLEALGDIPEATSKYITKTDLANALDGISVNEEDTFEEVKAQFMALVNNLKELTVSEPES